MNTGQIIKSKTTLVPNKIFQLGLSLESIGLLLLILFDGGIVSKSDLKNKSGLNTFKFNNLFRELQSSGVIKTTKTNTTGKFNYTHEINL